MPSFWEQGAEDRVNNGFFLNAFSICGTAIGMQLHQHLGKVLRLVPIGWDVLRNCIPDVQLPKNHELERLDMSCLGLDFKDELSIRLLGSCDNLLGLTCHTNTIDTDGLKRLAESALPGGTCAKVRTLVMTNNNVLAGREPWEPFAAAVAKGAFADLRVFEISSCSCADGFASISEAMALGAFPHLQILLISQNDLTDDSMEAFAAAIHKGAIPELQELHMPENRMVGERGFNAIWGAARAGKMQKVNRIEIHMTGINDASLAVLGEALAEGALPMLLRFVCAIYEDVGDAGAVAFLRGLDRGRHQKFQDFVFPLLKNVGDATVNALLDLIANSATPCWRNLRQVEFKATGISAASLDALTKMMASGVLPGLEEVRNGGLVLPTNDDTLLEFADALANGKLPMLKTFEIHSNFISDRAQAALNAAIKAHPKNAEGIAIDLSCYSCGAHEIEGANRTGAQGPSASEEDADAAKDASGAAKGSPQRLLIGSVNFLGGDMNPFQFTPPIADICEGLDMEARDAQAAWDSAAAEAKKAFYEFTIADAVALVASVPIVSKGLDEFVKTEKLTGETSCATFFDKDPELLGLDNKWAPRNNPVVFSLVSCKTTRIDQRLAVLRDYDGYVSQIVDYFATKYFEECVSLHPPLFKKWASLLLFDLQCTTAVKRVPDAFDQLARSSYLLGVDGREQTPTNLRIHDIMGPLKALRDRDENIDAVSVIGCQELAADVTSWAALRSALPEQMEVYIPSDDSEDTVHSGFLMTSGLSFKDVTGTVREDCRAMLSDLGLKKDVVDTTCRKLVIVIIELHDGRNVCVINVHCKSFKKNVTELADFIVGVRDLTKKAHPNVAETLVVGDTNLESKWPKSMPPAAQQEAVERAEVGTMPKELLGLAPTTFANRLQAPGTGDPMRPYPPISSFTSLKKRTYFQGQTDKADALICADKDFLFVPEQGRVRVLDTIVGGRPEGVTDNMDLLMPSRAWPCDHYAVLCELELDPEGA